MKQPWKKYLVLFLIVAVFLLQLVIRTVTIDLPDSTDTAVIMQAKYLGFSDPDIDNFRITKETPAFHSICSIIKQCNYRGSINLSSKSHSLPDPAEYFHIRLGNTADNQLFLTYEIYSDGYIKINGDDVHCSIFSGVDGSEIFESLKQVIE